MTTLTLDGCAMFRLLMFNVPALLNVPPLRFNAGSVCAAVVSIFKVPLLLMLVSSVSAAVVLFKFKVPLLLMLVRPLLKVVLLKLTIPPVTERFAIAFATNVLFRLVTALPLFASVPITTALVMVLVELPEKLTVPVPVIGAVPVRVLVPPAKFSVALSAALKLPLLAPPPPNDNVPKVTFTALLKTELLLNVTPTLPPFMTVELLMIPAPTTKLPLLVKPPFAGVPALICPALRFHTPTALLTMLAPLDRLSSPQLPPLPFWVNVPLLVSTLPLSSVKVLTLSGEV